MSKEFGWYKILMRGNTEKETDIAPRHKANKPPFSVSIVFHTTIIVHAPNNAGKNFTQKTALPSFKMM